MRSQLCQLPPVSMMNWKYELREIGYEFLGYGVLGLSVVLIILLGMAGIVPPIVLALLGAMLIGATLGVVFWAFRRRSRNNSRG